MPRRTWPPKLACSTGPWPMASAWRVSTAAASCWPAGASPCSMMAWGSAWCHGGLSSNNDSVCRFLRRYMTAAYPGKSDGNRAYLLSEASSISSTHCKDASTSVLDVDDRNAPDAHAAQRHLSGDQHLVGHDTSSGVADRKSTRLNSSHLVISYAVFCLKKK